jgi:uncharacterized membrane protein
MSFGGLMIISSLFDLDVNPLSTIMNITFKSTFLFLGVSMAASLGEK